MHPLNPAPKDATDPWRQSIPAPKCLGSKMSLALVVQYMILGNCVHSIDETCEFEFDGVGRYSAADGDVNACINHQRDIGLSFAIIWQGYCYGSSTCNSTTDDLTGVVNFEVQFCTGTLLILILS